MEKRIIKLVKVKSIHPSSVLPPRTHCPEVGESVKSVGVLQPLIVRSIKSSPGEYELIDGGIRFDALDPEEEVLVDVRDNVTDTDVFRISEATFQRKDRSAYEKVCFYAEWLKTLEKETGKSEGLQAELAKQVNLTESAISQCLSTYKMFEKLKSLSPNDEFNALKGWSVNKLYALSEVSEDPSFLEIARMFEMKGDVSIEEIEHFLSERESRKVEEFFESIDEERQNASESKMGSASVDFSAGKSTQHTKYKSFLDCAQRVSKLETETHETLSALVQEMLSNTERFSSVEIHGILTNLLQVLKKLKRQANALNEKIKSQGKLEA